MVKVIGKEAKGILMKDNGIKEGLKDMANIYGSMVIVMKDILKIV